MILSAHLRFLILMVAVGPIASATVLIPAVGRALQALGLMDKLPRALRYGIKFMTTKLHGLLILIAAPVSKMPLRRFAAHPRARILPGRTSAVFSGSVAM